MNRRKIRAFTLIESLFALLILSIISMTFVFGINYFSKAKRRNLEIVEKINEIEMTLNQIRFNILNRDNPLKDVDSKLKIEVRELEEMYYISIDAQDPALGEKYEAYFKK